MDLRVREWRERRRFSYRALAKRASIGLSTLYRIESGAASPTVAMLERLAGALEVPRIFTEDAPRRDRDRDELDVPDFLK